MTLEAPKGSREFMDAPNATPSDEQYEDAHSRYGTDRFTDVDAKVIATWRQQNPDWDKEPTDDEGSEPKSLYGEPADDEDDYTYESETVEYLKDELKKRGLPTSGNKSELVTRLEEDDASKEE